MIGLLVLSFAADNVSMKTSDYSGDARGAIVKTITEDGKLTKDINSLRQAAREMLASFHSCRPGYDDSGLVARIAGDAIGADAHSPEHGNGRLPQLPVKSRD